jgi:hypothetical protein
MRMDQMKSRLQLAAVLAGLALAACGGEDPQEPTPRTTREDLLLGCPGPQPTCPPEQMPACKKGAWVCAGLSEYPGGCSGCLPQ